MNTTLVTTEEGKDTSYCLILGGGFLGSHFLRDVKERGLSGSINVVKYQQINVQWEDIDSVNLKLTALLKGTENSDVDIIWALGKGGFGSSTEQMEKEFFLLKRILQIVMLIDHQGRAIHFMSSAGGIYEGQGNVLSTDQCSPISPYGIWKLKQEALLSQFDITRCIYRISSVYGYSGKGHRVGLIGALLNAIESNTLFTCTGYKDTLRDYIYCQDVVSYVVDNMLLKKQNSIEVIASGEAYSIQNIIEMVSDITKQGINVEYLEAPNNFRDITFSKSIIPSTLNSIPLRNGIKKMIHSFNEKNKAVQFIQSTER